MYRAKEHGRNNFQFYTAEMNSKVNERLALENSLRRALEREEFVAALPDQGGRKDRGDRRRGGAAALEPSRARLDAAGPVRALAEETGLIVQIGEWVLREACAQNQAWRTEGLPPITVSVNVSARQFRQGILVDAVSRILAETGLDPRCLEMELTRA